MTAVGVGVRPLLVEELDVVHRLNQAEVPNVGDVTRERLLALLAWSSVALAAVVDGGIVGFLIAMGPGTTYDSANYRWFQRRFDDFLYVDRVVVTEKARGLGVAGRLYDAALELDPAPVLAAEVNVEPPNPGSLAFHEAYGFRELDRVAHQPGYAVAMLVYDTGLTRDA